MSARGLYAIVDPDHCGGRDALEVADAILRGGCAVLQLRSKTLSDARFETLGAALLSRCRAAGVPFVVNDRPRLAARLGADGLHLGQDDMELSLARSLVGAMAVGLSTHDLSQARAAVRAGANLIGFGPIYATQSKENPDPVVGPDGLRAVVQELGQALPVVAIGGVSAARMPELRQAGVPLAAAIGAVCGAADPERAAAALHRALR